MDENATSVVQAVTPVTHTFMQTTLSCGPANYVLAICGA